MKEDGKILLRGTGKEYKNHHARRRIVCGVWLFCNKYPNSLLCIAYASKTDIYLLNITEIIVRIYIEI